MNKTKITTEISIGGQPESADLQQLKKDGYRSVINLRRPDENHALTPSDEGKVVQSLGMEYFNLPVSPQKLTASEAEKFREKMRELPKPVFVHCQGGTRAGAFALLHLGTESGWTGEEAFGKAEKAGFKCESPALRQFVSAYLAEQSRPDKG